jgi:hypothetical protein
MFNTHQCERIGVFEIKESCKSIAVTKDSKYLIAAPTTKGIYVYSVSDGKLLKTVKVQCSFTKHVAMSYSDKQVLVIFEDKKINYIRIYEFADIMKENNENARYTEIVSSDSDIAYTDCVWGPLDKTLYISTNRGKILVYNVEKKKFENEA